MLKRQKKKKHKTGLEAYGIRALFGRRHAKRLHLSNISWTIHVLFVYIAQNICLKLKRHLWGDSEIVASTWAAHSSTNALFVCLTFFTPKQCTSLPVYTAVCFIVAIQVKVPRRKVQQDLPRDAERPSGCQSTACFSWLQSMPSLNSPSVFPFFVCFFLQLVKHKISVLGKYQFLLSVLFILDALAKKQVVKVTVKKRHKKKTSYVLNILYCFLSLSKSHIKLVHWIY